MFVWVSIAPDNCSKPLNKSVNSVWDGWFCGWNRIMCGGTVFVLFLAWSGKGSWFNLLWLVHCLSVFSSHARLFLFICSLLHKRIPISCHTQQWLLFLESIDIKQLRGQLRRHPYLTRTPFTRFIKHKMKVSTSITSFNSESGEGWKTKNPAQFTKTKQWLQDYSSNFLFLQHVFKTFIKNKYTNRVW